MKTWKSAGPRKNDVPPVSDEDLEAEKSIFAEFAEGVTFVDADGNEVEPKAAESAGDDPIEDGEEDGEDEDLE